MQEGILLLLVELKLYFRSLKDHIAQVLLELLCEFFSSTTRVLISETRKPLIKKNRNRNLHPQPPVYAILTDMEMFYFFRYDGFRFSYSEQIFVKSNTRETLNV